MAGLCTVRFLFAVRAVVARCKLPIALCPGLTQEDVFFIYSYSHSTYILDHGGVHFAQFSCPQPVRRWHVASSPYVLRPGLSQENMMRTKEITKGKEKERKRNKGNPGPPLLLLRRCHEGGHE